jgi:phosphoglycerate dehydrogenase-like enzyme
MQIPEENLRANVVITPHTAFNSEEALRRILDVTAENVRVPLRRPPKPHRGPVLAVTAVSLSFQFNQGRLCTFYSQPR